MGDGEGDVGSVVRSPEDDELVSVATKLVAQVLAKAIVEESLRLPSCETEITDRNNVSVHVQIKEFGACTV